MLAMGVEFVGRWSFVGNVGGLRVVGELDSFVTVRNVDAQCNAKSCTMYCDL